ncbi:Uncharacterised protein [uncultured archaeon]|nr:Uncharacterised protein [uncultured archaeon]
MDEGIKINSRGQITIFIILALIIVVAILFFFALKQPAKPQVYDENNPQSYIEQCTRDAVSEAIGILSPQGGDINPRGSVLYDGVDRVYLCYNNDFYKRCVNQRPMLVEHLEDQITEFIRPKVADCFKSLEMKLEKRYTIETEDMNLRTRLYPRQITVEIDKKFKMSREDKVININQFRMNMISPLYNFAEIGMEIANQQAQYCHFDDLGFMIFYPSFDVTSTKTGESDNIYTIKERATNQQFTFATRSCLLPPGF